MKLQWHFLPEALALESFLLDMREVFIVTYLAISPAALSNCTTNKPQGSSCPEGRTVCPVALQKWHITAGGGVGLVLSWGFLWFHILSGSLVNSD